MLMRPRLNFNVRPSSMIYPSRHVARTWASTTTAATSPGVDPDDEADTDGKRDARSEGHIKVGTNESVLFFDNLFPVSLSNVLGRVYSSDKDLVTLLKLFKTSSLGIMDPIRLVKAAIPPDLLSTVTEIHPRLKDGGAFVKFRHDASVDPLTIEETLIRNLNDAPLHPWFNPLRGIKARLVCGTPWLEDLRRYPSNLIKVEFTAATPDSTPQELSEETIYSLLRKYGKISDIAPQAQDDKALPRYATVAFVNIRDAIMARNCMHGIIVGAAMGGGAHGTRLRFSHRARIRPHNIWNWVTTHPRIVIPIVAALLAGVSVIIFDPIRQFFIKMHIQHSWSISESRLYKWFKSQKDSLIPGSHGTQHDDLSAVWNHRRDLIEQLRSWLDGSSDTFIVVTGPKGSGKKDMVLKQTLDGRKNVLEIDCRPISEARGEAGVIRRLAAAVGYRPVFSWANNISSMVDLAIQGTTGVKAGFSETLESQFNKIFYTTSSALKEVALSARTKRDKDADLTDDAYLESHPERRPVIVIDNFMHKAEDKGLAYDKLAEWAATVVQNNIAHVIFLTSDTSYTKPLAKALPDRVLRTLSLGDLDLDVARNFVLSRVREDTRTEEEKESEQDAAEAAGKPLVHKELDLTGLDESIRTMGGRLTDLEFLSRRIKSGQTPKQAVDEIVSENATDIVKMFLLGKSVGSFTDPSSRSWSTQQAWHLVRELAREPTLRYNQVVLSAPFASSTTPSAKDGEAALEGLAGADLIMIKLHRGRPQSITAGKPLNQAAFSVLLDDPVLSARMDLAVLKEDMSAKNKEIEGLESELALLGGLPRQTNEIANRARYLLEKMDDSQQKIIALEKKMGELKAILSKEF
ncbi:RNA12 protein [Geosmithia morbida]|uniref:Mitochondrial escape protein 2 n=1 Tax=Geosmithia morbida TaxID=1094350 RepID=A0A9P5D288_9HYPO|nr:RNA12 protein [Geosmithia morbida]KAF4123602.1 RNA12 protein [Geosmithia morbida]